VQKCLIGNKVQRLGYPSNREADESTITTAERAGRGRRGWSKAGRPADLFSFFWGWE